MIITVLAFLLTLGVLILVHEYGHYRVAVACGVKVQRFSIGFGRALWRGRRGETEFVLGLLPLGGYVKMLDEREGDVPAHELDRAFNRKPLWQRAAVVVAGPTANLLLAWLLFAAASWWGVSEPKALLGSPLPASLAERAGQRAGDLVQAVSTDGTSWTDVASYDDLIQQVAQAVLRGETLHLSLADAQGRGPRESELPLATLGAREVDAALVKRIGLGQPYREPVMADVLPGGPAAKAGLRRGDRVLSVDGIAVADAGQLHEMVRASARDGQAHAMNWHIERNEHVLDVSVTPEVAKDKERAVGRIEAYLGGPVEMVTVQRGPVEGLVRAGVRTWDTAKLNLQLLGKMLIGKASLKNLSGPLTIADYAGQSVQRGLAYYLGFLAIVSVGL
ncbi:MAG TPA: RIP metalloprotease RseP, partial [Methylibium sp.]